MAYLDTEEYAVYPLLNQYFEDYPIDAIDFARHLKAQVALNKKVVKDETGRPVTATYDLEGLKIAEIRFDFTIAPNGLIVRKKLWLKYALKNGSFADNFEEILIKDKKYDLTDSVDLEYVVTERENARRSIMASMKGVVLGVIALANNGMPSDQVVTLIQPFWDAFAMERDDFIELGAPNFKDGVELIDLASTPHTWLNIPMPQGGVVRDYIVHTLSY